MRKAFLIAFCVGVLVGCVVAVRAPDLREGVARCGYGSGGETPEAIAWCDRQLRGFYWNRAHPVLYRARILGGVGVLAGLGVLLVAVPAVAVTRRVRRRRRPGNGSPAV